MHAAFLNFHSRSPAAHYTHRDCTIVIVFKLNRTKPHCRNVCVRHYRRGSCARTKFFMSISPVRPPQICVTNCSAHATGIGVARGCTGFTCTPTAEKTMGRGQIYRGKLIRRESQNFKSRSRDRFPTPFDLIFHFLVSASGDQSACQI